MNREQLSDAIGRLDESIVSEAMTRRSRRPWWYSAVAVAACVALAVGMVAVWPHLKPDNTKPKVDMTMDSPTVSTMESGGTTTQGGQTIVITTTRKPAEVLTPQPIAFALAQPKYPKMAARPANYYGGNEDAYDAWWEDRRAQRMQADGHTDGMTDYYADTMAQFLAGKAGENRVYSPLNVYLALSMLAETAEGNSRQQILNLLGVSDLTALREKCSGLWNGVYLNDGAVTSVLANSLWLAEGDRWTYDEDTVNALADHYYASVFEGEMGSAKYDKALQDWLNAQTDNLLKEQADGLGFDPDTVLALASTICFRAKWTGWFDEKNNQQGVFHTSAGKEVSCTYMRSSPMTEAYFGDRFTAVSKGLDDGGYQMIFFLPDEGVAVDTLINDKQVLSLMQGYERTVDSKFLRVHMSVPKFDVVSDQDLIGGLKELGVTDVFDAQKSNFGGILEEQSEPVWVNQVQHAARVAIDEEGVTAAAYTVMTLAGSPMPEDEMDFVLDRPFMFAITGPGDTILFTGVVENP
ncbi:MAG: hypothetical protein IKL13_05690 [Clostridia bacterium]|nr:hypothetical protein [Clostridia bacterium]